MNFKKLIIISGATATGKTSLSLHLADVIKKDLKKKCCIVNFDSLLFYKELNIGTAKPTSKERAEHPHSLIDIVSAKTPLNANDYIRMAKDEIDKAHKSNIIPILVGGSAFYLRALIKGMYQSETVSQEIKDEVEALYKNSGIDPFIEFLKKHDPETINILHDNDHYRIMRAYEHIRQTGEAFSIERKKMELLDPYDLSTNDHPEWDLHHIYLEIPREEHWPYIVDRTKKMISSGLVSEVTNLLASGFSGNEKPLKSIGYQETLDYLNKKFTSEEDFIERIAISTRQLAKSQRTFFNKIKPKLTYHPLKNKEEIEYEALAFIRE